MSKNSFRIECGKIDLRSIQDYLFIKLTISLLQGFSLICSKKSDITSADFKGSDCRMQWGPTICIAYSNGLGIFFEFIF